MDWRDDLARDLEETDRLARQLEDDLAAAVDGSDPEAQRAARARLERRSRDAAERFVEEFQRKGVL